jgi:hypothetical protein
MLFGWTSMYYGRYEKGQLIPNKNNIKVFSEFLEISEEDLMIIIENGKDTE